jgi:hypothetical protein
LFWFGCRRRLGFWFRSRWSDSGLSLLRSERRQRSQSRLASSPDPPPGPTRPIGGSHELLVVTSFISVDEPHTRSALVDEGEVDVLISFKHIAEQAVIAVYVVKPPISNEPNSSAGRKKLPQCGTGLVSVALAPTLRSIDLDEMDAIAVIEFDGVAVDNPLYTRCAVCRLNRFGVRSFLALLGRRRIFFIRSRDSEGDNDKWHKDARQDYSHLALSGASSPKPMSELFLQSETSLDGLGLYSFWHPSSRSFADPAQPRVR